MKTSQLWLDANVVALRDVTPTVREFTLQPGDGVEPFEPGSHLQVQVMVGQGARATAMRMQTRSYSLIGQPDGLHYRIAVKCLADGRGGSMAMWRLAVGDRLRIMPPQNHFPLDLRAPAYLLVAGGIGITPLLGMAQSLAARGADVRLCYGARADNELAYLSELQTALGNQVCSAVAGRGEMIPFAREIAALPEQAQMYVCGPVPMLDAARRAWAEAGRAPALLRYETFGSSGRFAPEPFRIKLPRHQLDVEVSRDASLLDTLEEQGVMALYDCRRGECGLCAMDVLSVHGEIDHRDVFLSDHEKAANKRICVCVSRVVGPQGSCGEITLESAYRPDS